ncbi:ester cyclase [Caldilinea sp.]|jgi:predicted ester cyclase|uniref:ester cyclase n=1 Tax=Caldilinea sp. TaxID=2293560 RepID=UPI001B03D25A|nr:ester cyclase [Caldilinea sp.]MBO9394039.1 ester cyclase [Caldilinea sp.]
MSHEIHQQNKQRIASLRAALYDGDVATLLHQLQTIFAPNCQIHLTFPFKDLTGPDALFEQVYSPLLYAAPDLERRDFILMAGPANGENWVGCAGFYIGVFERPWLGIPPTQHIIAMRYHEFFRMEAGQVVEMQALWDIPQLMMQANAWPMTPSLGVEWLVPGPAPQDGILTGPYDPAKAEASVKLVHDMLTAMGRHPQQGGVEIMELERYWHPKMMWYGPAGIGTARRISGFRRCHQIPFLKAMPDRAVFMDQGVLFGDGDYVGFTAWPGMHMTISGDGWLGIAPCNQKITMRSLDFWRCENGQIRENWILVDLLHVYNQIGVDVFSRMREVTFARQSPA